MKKLTFLVPIAFAIASCTNNCPEESGSVSSNGNDLLPNTVKIKYEHNLTDSLFTDRYSVFELSSFVNNFVEKALTEDLPLYDGLDVSHKISKDEIQSTIGKRIDTLVDIDINTLDTVVTIVENSFNKQELTRLFMLEEWSFNKEKFKMTKEVSRYAPIRVYLKDKGSAQKELVKNLLFWVKKKEEPKSKKLLVKNYAYEFDLYNMSNPDWLQDLSVNRFVDIILNSVLEEKVTAYEFDFFSKEEKKLNLTEVRERLGATIENYVTDDMDTVQVIGNIYPDEIRSVIFVEDWYLDESTMAIIKDVKRIIPIRKYDRVDETTGEIEEVKTIPFFVNLN